MLSPKAGRRRGAALVAAIAAVTLRRLAGP